MGQNVDVFVYRLRGTLAGLRINGRHNRWPLHRPWLLILGSHSGIIAVKPMHRSGRLEQLVQGRGRASGLGHTLAREKPRLAGEVGGAGADV